MGCTPSQRKDLRTHQKKQTKVGNLRIIVTGGQFYEVAKQFKQMKNPLFHIQVSNQVYRSGPVNKIKQQSPVKQTFYFWINSQYKGNGRYIEIQLLANEGGEARAYGIVDLDQIINRPSVQQQIKVILNRKNSPIGFVNLKTLFRDQGYQKLAFRFQNCTLRRKTRLLADMNVSVRVTIGQQTLQTKRKKDTKQQSVSWHETILQFLVPKQIKEGMIQIFDQKDLIGSYKLNLQDILAQPEGDEIMHVEQLNFNNENAGTIKFSVISGQKGTFGTFTQKFLKSTIVLNRSRNQIQQS